mmetsp:Transcript_81271/g.131718  ORF Transcript_81271/g.131718 Transcript_81271/m.131718 type:complete len:354 (+) Transcript_81271:1528-2589(+)
MMWSASLSSRARSLPSWRNRFTRVTLGQRTRAAFQRCISQRCSKTRTKSKGARMRTGTRRCRPVAGRHRSRRRQIRWWRLLPSSVTGFAQQMQRSRQRTQRLKNAKRPWSSTLAHCVAIMSKCTKKSNSSSHIDLRQAVMATRWTWKLASIRCPTLPSTRLCMRTVLIPSPFSIRSKRPCAKTKWIYQSELCWKLHRHSWVPKLRASSSSSTCSSCTFSSSLPSTDSHTTLDVGVWGVAPQQPTPRSRQLRHFTQQQPKPAKNCWPINHRPFQSGPLQSSELQGKWLKRLDGCCCSSSQCSECGTCCDDVPRCSVIFFLFSSAAGCPVGFLPVAHSVSRCGWWRSTSMPRLSA